MITWSLIVAASNNDYLKLDCSSSELGQLVVKFEDSIPFAEVCYVL
jgi:hypothetical protein